MLITRYPAARHHKVNLPSRMETVCPTTPLIAIMLSALIALSAEAVSKVTFDNQSGRPALVKVVGPTASAVSIGNGNKQSLSVTPGHYFIKVRYGTPGAYSFSKGDEFDVAETATTASETTITLHKVVAGNYGSKSISEAEFGTDEHTAKQHTAPIGDSWRTNMTEFVNRLFSCVQKYPQTPSGPQLTLGIQLELDNGYYFVFYADDASFGKTAQGEINRMIGDGRFEWTSRITEIRPAKADPTEVVVNVEFPKFESPLPAWKIPMEGFGFKMNNAEVQRLGLSVGKWITFSGTIAKKEKSDIQQGVSVMYRIKPDPQNLIWVLIGKGEKVVIKKVFTR